MTHQPHRIHTFDLLRGLAVLTMMLAHSVYFFHSRDSTFLLSVEGFGNIVSFVTFLLVSGAVTSVAYFGSHRAGKPVNRKRVVMRVLLFLVAYYILALVLISDDLLGTEGFARIRLIFDILSFKHLPGFTEYFPPFIFYSALIAFLPGLFRVISRKLINVILVSIVAYGAGMWLYQLPVGPELRPWMALVAGADELFRFPLLQYLPVFLLGLYWGHRTVTTEGLAAKRLFAANAFWFFALIATAGYSVSLFLDIPLQTIFVRWPPGIPFLALGLAFAFLAAGALYRVRQLRRVLLLRDFLLLLGQNALGIFWSHIFLLGLYAFADGPQVSSIAIFVFLFLLLVLLSLALTTFLPFNFRLALTTARGSHEEHEEAIEKETVFQLSQEVATEAAQATRGLRRYFFPSPASTSQRVLRKRHRLGIFLVAVAAASIIFPATIEEIALQGQERGADAWWSDAYPYRQQLTLKNTEQFVTLPVGTAVAMRFNHQQLVDERKSLANGQDVKLVYWTGEQHLVAESVVDRPGTTEATLKFKAPEKIQAGKDERFYSLYYGNFIGAHLPPEFRITTDATVRATAKPEEMYPLVATVATNWSLIGQPEGDRLTVNLTTAQRHPNATVTYQILDTSLSGPMFQSSDTSWEGTAQVAGLAAGAYRVQVTLREQEREQKSQLTGFYRSHPLYVAWTHDWEGYDVNQAYLNAMEAIASHYQLPITHFFNPRIYITKTIKPERARALTQWVQRRLQLGDGYGLHLHLFHDFVEQAGLDVRKEPNWGDRGDGYGVPLSAYSEVEQLQLIDNALDLLFANGMPKTKTFRAGGWFANLDTLAALEQLDFEVDSSARTRYQFGRNRLQGSWDIAVTMRPYYPSRTNQSRPNPNNHFSILEIPNNGADSYAFSAEAMIERFTANYGNGILTEPQQVTYLSHPHWFDEKEQERIRQLFDYISDYTFLNDRGPVIFTTTDVIATIWANAD